MIREVAIDLDGVMYPFAQEFQKFCSKALNRPDLSPATHWHFYQDWGLTFPEYHALLLEATHAGLFLHGEPPVGAQAAWEILRDMNLRVNIITARPPEAWADTTWWLDHWMLKADNLYFTNHKWLFSDMLQGAKGAMLEDSPEHLRTLANFDNVIPVAFDQPWNQEVDCLRVQSLMGFARLISLYNKEHPNEPF
jgi:hypothetical protein